LDVVRKVLQTVGDREKNYDQMVNILFLIGSRESTCHAFNLLAIDMRVGASNIVQIALEHHALENLLLWMLYEDQVNGEALFLLMEMIRGCETNAEYILYTIKSVAPVCWLQPIKFRTAMEFFLRVGLLSDYLYMNNDKSAIEELYQLLSRDMNNPLPEYCVYSKE
jgi:hypothetical protein